MSYNRFQVQCAVRVILLGITVYLFFFLIFFTNFRLTLAFFAIVPVLQLLELLHYVQKTNRALTHFLESIHYADFTAMLPQNSSDPMFRDLYQALNQVMQQFQRIRMEREAQYMYLQTVVQHIGIGVITFTADGEIDLVNQTFTRMFGIRTARNLADLEIASPELHQLLLHIADQQSSLFTLTRDSREEQFAVSATRFWVPPNRVHAGVVSGHSFGISGPRNGCVAKTDPGAESRNHELADSYHVAGLNRERNGGRYHRTTCRRWMRTGLREDSERSRDY